MGIRDTIAKAFAGRGFDVVKARRKTDEVFRPEFDYTRLGRTRGIQLPLSPIHPMDIEEVAKLSVVIRTAVTNIRNEVFRRGYEWSPRFIQKCLRCDKEFDVKRQKCDNDKCECTEFVEPSEKERKRAEEFFEKVNKNRENLMWVLSQFEQDLLIHDDAYLVFIKEYLWDGKGKVVHSNVKEIIRGSPLFMRCIGDRRGNRGGVYFVCLQHRDFISQDPEDRCQQCNSKLYDVWYVGTEWGEKPTEFYVGPSDEDEGECLKVSRYSPTLLYGTSLLLSCWKLVVSLLYMENYIHEYYRYMRRPRGFIAVNTKSAEALQRWWDNISRRVQEDPHYTPLVAIENEQGRGRVQFVPLDSTLYEMQYIQVRDEFRDRIFALYGVSREFVNAQRAGVGLANEGLQILVTNRMVEWCQTSYNDVVFPYLLAQLRIKDWDLRLKPSEAKDQMATLARFDKKVDIAKKVMTLGYDIEMEVNGSGDDLDNYYFVYRKKDLPPVRATGIPPPLGMPGMPTFPAFEPSPLSAIPPPAAGELPMPTKEEITGYNEQGQAAGGQPTGQRMKPSRQRFSGEPEVPQYHKSEKDENDT